MAELLTRQQIFDKVVAHLRSQKKKAVKMTALNVQRCQYKTEDGLKCAIGCLIKDELLTPEFLSRYEDTAAYGLSYDVLRESGINISELGMGTFLYELQKIHDRNDPVHWEEELQRFAEGTNLKYEVQVPL